MSKKGKFFQGLKVPSQDDGFSIPSLEARLEILNHNKEVVLSNIHKMRDMQIKYPKLDYKDEIYTEQRRIAGIEAHIKYILAQLAEENAKQ